MYAQIFCVLYMLNVCDFVEGYGRIQPQWNTEAHDQ